MRGPLRDIAGILTLLALAACNTQPSKLDDLPESDWQWRESQPWIEIEQRALPMSIRNDLLQAAVAVPDRGTLDERAAALVAWMDARGSVPVATTLAAFNAPGFELFASRILELVRARPDNDRIFEAALYAASKLRADGTGIVAAVMANFINKKLAEMREVPPPYAATYAPTDEQVFRLFATEAMYLRRAAFELDDVAGAADDLAMWREFANAPNRREAFVAFVDRTVAAHSNSRITSMLHKYAQQMFDAVDDYQTWLGRRVAPPSPP